jgi:SPOR domain
MKPSVEPRRVLPRGLLTIVTLLSFAAIIWYAYPTGQEKYAGKDIPLITADKTAYKFKPEDPGGMEVPHQDSTVFAPLEKGGDKAVEKLRPAPEEPLDKDTALAQPMKKPPIDTQPKDMTLSTIQEIPEKVGAPEKVETLVSPPKPEVKAEAVKPQAKPDTKKPEAKPVVKAEAKPVAPKPEVKAEVKPSIVAVEAQPLPPLAPATPVEKANVPPATGGVYIQLGAYRDLAGAKADWTLLQKKHSELKGLSMHTEVVKIAGKGPLTRLQAGKVAEARAKEICSLMKARGNNGCMVVR